MNQKSLKEIFSEYVSKKSIFKDKNALTFAFKPSEIVHRDKQIQELASILAPSLRSNNLSNTFIYGGVGTGKTLVVKRVTKELEDAAQEAKVNLKIIYTNCKMKKVADTEYRLLAQLTRELGEEIPATGLPTDEVYSRFFRKLEEQEGTVILILDEIDALVKKIGDNFLYNLTRINAELKRTKVFVIGISNDLNFTEYMDARVKSSLSEEELIFPPYNAMELVDILLQRSKIGFNDGVLQEGVIQKCAALAAQEHGDARRALDLLRVAGEIAERSNTDYISTKHVDLAQAKIEKDRTVEAVKSQPKHAQVLLYALLNMHKNNGNNIATGDVYASYKNLCSKLGITSLTQRRVSDLISELDMLGILNARVISKGRYGRTRSISLDLSDNVLGQIESFLKEKFY